MLSHHLDMPIEVFSGQSSPAELGDLCVLLRYRQLVILRTESAIWSLRCSNNRNAVS